MADFLTRLASRTLGLAPMAEPVIAPMFAPDPSLPAMAGSDEPLDAAQQAAEPVEPRGAAGLPSASPIENAVRPVAARSRPDPTEARLAPPSVGEMTSRAATAAPDDGIVRDSPTRRRPPLSSAAASEIADEDALLMPAAGAMERRSPVEASMPAETPLLARPYSPDPSRTPAAWREEPADSVVRSVAGRGRGAPLSSWDVGPDESLLLPLNPAETPSMRRDARAPAVVTPADELEPPRRAERGQAAAMPPSSPPTIEVTIGRVEVRAVHPPAPVARPKAAAPAAPSLSLEEYLRNQNGGRR
jgi:hypothetical protein